jgi:hypothetical protein
MREWAREKEGKYVPTKKRENQLLSIIKPN